MITSHDREAIMSIRPVKKLMTAKPTLEGAGVHLRRAFGFGQTSDYDPFLLLDDFRNDIPATPPAEVDNRALVLFDRGDEVVVQGGENGIRFLLVSGQPLQEPVAWHGPIVMNTQAELRQAFDELEQTTFLKEK
jgi:redox-sensitive bicupin YhaK (pirin superfamily)